VNTETPASEDPAAHQPSAESAPAGWSPIMPSGAGYETGHLPAASDADFQKVWVVPTAPADPGEPLKARLLVAAGVAVVVALLGFPLGWLWSSVAPWLPVRVSGNELFYAEPEGEQRAAAEGWFIVLSIGAGIVVALVVWFALRRFRGSLTIAGLAIGSTIAGWLAWRFGHNIGRSTANNLARHAKDGTLLKFPPDLRIKPVGNIGQWHGLPYLGGVLLYFAVAAVATYVLIVGFSSSSSLSLRRHRETPAPVATPVES